MSNNPNRPTLNLAIEWLRLHHDELIELWSIDQVSFPNHYFSEMTPERRRGIGEDHFKVLIECMEGKPFPTDELKNTFIFMLGEQGADLTALSRAAGLFEKTLALKVAQSLTGQPEVKAFILQKISYLTNLIRVAMATATIEHTLKQDP